jgi:glucokinase
MSQQPELVVAMDWGGTWIRTSVIDPQGVLLWNIKIPTPRHVNERVMLAAAESTLTEAFAWCNPGSIIGIGIAVAGPIDTETGIFYTPPNLANLDGVSLKEEWESKFGYPMYIGNDATLAALGEYHLGVGFSERSQGKNSQTLLYMTISTGVGGGLIDRGNVLMGAHGMAAEIGHIKIDSSESAPICNCGGSGCLESLISGTAIARHAQNLLKSYTGPTTVSNDLSESVTARDVFLAASRGDDLGKLILNEVVSNLSLGITNLIHSFNPDLVVLGGGVTSGLSEAGVLDSVYEIVLRSVMSERHKHFSLMEARLGDDSGMIGASLLVRASESNKI